MVVLFVGVSVLLSKTSLGRHIYAVGSNAEAARLSGVNVQVSSSLPMCFRAWPA